MDPDHAFLWIRIMRLWIRIMLSFMDPDHAFFLNVDTYPAQKTKLVKFYSEKEINYNFSVIF